MIPELAPLEGKYEILRKLREGGMGAIYLVRHRLLDELRVVKVLRPQIRDDADFRQRFVREARIATQLRHRNIAQVFDFAVGDDGTAFMVLEYIEGRTLQELIAEGAFGSLGLRLEIARQALRALDFLHRKGYVHRDVSPDNLMLTRDEEGGPLVKLLDLGIVKVLQQESGQLTGTSVFLGKWRYASPEQFQTSQVDARSDLYSFGVLLYELLTGQYPIEGNDMRSIVAGHLSRPPLAFERSDPEGRLPPELREVVLAALEKDPDHRISSARELSEALGRIVPPEEGGGSLPVPEQTARILGSPATFGAEPTTTQRRLDRTFSVSDRTPAGAELPALAAVPPEPPPTVILDSAPPAQPAVPHDGLRAATRPRRGRRLALAGWALAAVAMAATLALTLGRAGPEPVRVAETVPPPAAVPGGSETSPATSSATRPAPARVRAEESAVAAPVPALPLPAAVPLVVLVLDAHPWGRVVALDSLDGGPAIALPENAYTPLRLNLRPGRYRARFEHPDFGARTLEVEVHAGRAIERGGVTFAEDLARTFVEER